MRSNATRLVAPVLACLGTLSVVGSALAADYSVDFGIDTVSAGKDAGTVACQERQICRAKIESLGLSISFFWKESGEVVVELEKDDRTCCYFSGGGRSAIVKAHTKLARLPFFKGSAPRGGLFIQNEHAGILYLRFDRQ